MKKKSQETNLKFQINFNFRWFIPENIMYHEWLLM